MSSRELGQGDGMQRRRSASAENYDDIVQEYEGEDGDEDVPGAVGGGDIVDYGASAGGRRSFTDDEWRIISQTQVLLSRFVIDSAQRDGLQRDRYEVLCQVLKEESRGCQMERDDDILAKAVLTMGDDLNFAFSRNRKIDDWIDRVPTESAESVFKKVCTEMFKDDKINWGRIAVLFYLAYRMMVKSFSTGDWVGWIKKILRIALDFFCKFYVHWVVMQGGWRTILEYVHSSTKAAVILTAIGLVSFAYYFFSSD